MLRNARKRLWIPLLLLGAAFVLFGISRNEPTLLFSRASMICLECIGIG